MADETVAEVRYTLDGSTADLKLESITLGERIEIEEHMQMPYAQAVGSQWFVSEKLQAYLAFIAFRRRTKGLTFADVLKSKELGVEFDPSDPPTTAAPKRSRAKSGPRSS